MIVNVFPSAKFKREARKLIKKYNSLKEELRVLINDLIANPTFGARIGENTYKIRLAVKSKGKGKSGGLRIITYVVAKIVEDEDVKNVYLMAIYDKSAFENLQNNIIAERITMIREEYDTEDSEDETENNNEDIQK